MRLQRGGMRWACAAVCAGVVGQPALADRIDLVVYENAGNASLAGLDLWVDVLDAGGGKVDFVFHNDSTVSATITATYFEKTGLGAHLSNGLIHAQSSGVQFGPGATPPNPAQPGLNFGGAWGGNVFSANAAPPAPQNGINMGGVETLTVRFDLSTITVNDLVTGMKADPAQFRIATHVQELPGGYSVWAVTPAPGTLALAGLAGVVALRRRRA